MHSRWLRESSTTKTVVITPHLLFEVNLFAASSGPCCNQFTHIGRVYYHWQAKLTKIATNLKQGSKGDTYQKMLVANRRTIIRGLGGKYSAFKP
jgi:hypothetical protein